MKKLLGIIVLSLLLSCNAYAAGYKWGKGQLKVTKNTADILEFYFSGGTQGVYAEKSSGWKPGLIAISVDGSRTYLFRHPNHVQQIDSKHYTGMAISGCKKRAGQECFLFAKGYRIVWDNGSDKKKRKLKPKEVRSGMTIALLTELGFYNGSDSGSKNIKPKITKKKKIKKAENDDVVQKLKDLKELLDSGVITSEEFKKAKKKLLN